MDLFTAFLVVFAVLAAACAAVYQASRMAVARQAAAAPAPGSESGEGAPSASEAAAAAATSGEFVAFQRQYLLIYVVVMMSDWLQGPYVYALYKAYGFSKLEIGQLFVAGFSSSMIFGTFVGSLADKLGRKRMALCFCVVYGASCATKLSPNFAVLMAGRLLAGVATSLLFSVFEAWLVSEHKVSANWRAVSCFLCCVPILHAPLILTPFGFRRGGIPRRVWRTPLRWRPFPTR